MPNPIDITNIPAPRVDFIDPRTGLMAREWYRFFFNLFNLTGGGSNDTSLLDLQIGPPPINSVLGEINTGFDQAQLAAMSDQAEAVLGQLGIVYDQAQLASMVAQYEQAALNLQNQFDTIPAAPQLGTIASYNLDGSPVAGGVGYGTGSAIAFTPAGTSGQFLTSAAAGTPTWTTPSSVAVTSFSAGTTGLTPSSATTGAITLAGTLIAANGGTGQTSYAVGDLLYADTTTSLAKLADVATGNALISGGVGVAPAWGKIGLTTHVSGTLPVANGGTGLTSGTSGGVLYYSASGTLASSGALTSNALVVGGGTGAAPSTITTGTGVVTALGVNTGTAGAFVVNGGVLGTPSSGTLTSCTGLPLTTGVTGVLPVANGGTNASTASITSFNNITGYTATGATGTTSTNLVFSGSPTIATPTITTSATVPLVIGGTGTTSTLTLRSTSGVGAAGADIIFQTGNNGATEAIRILNSGNVGIGTAAPSTLLHIANGNAALLVENTAASSNATLQLKYPSRTWSIATRGSDLSGAFVIRDSTASADRFIIDTSGNVGVGTTSPGAKLDVSGTQAGISNPANGVVNVIDSASAAQGVGGQIVFRGSYTGTTLTQYAAITAYKESATVDGTQYGAALIFNTRTQGASNSEKMRITSAGNVYPASGTTSMTDGFFYIPAAAGAPSGVPTAISGRVPMYYDTTNNKFYIYNGAWKSVALA